MSELPDNSQARPSADDSQCLMAQSVPLVNLTGITLEVSDPVVTNLVISVELFTVGTFGFQPIERGGNEVHY